MQSSDDAAAAAPIATLPRHARNARRSAVTVPGLSDRAPSGVCVAQPASRMRVSLILSLLHPLCAVRSGAADARNADRGDPGSSASRQPPQPSQAPQRHRDSTTGWCTHNNRQAYSSGSAQLHRAVTRCTASQQPAATRAAATRAFASPSGVGLHRYGSLLDGRVGGWVDERKVNGWVDAAALSGVDYPSAARQMGQSAHPHRLPRPTPSCVHAVCDSLLCCRPRQRKLEADPSHAAAGCCCCKLLDRSDQTDDRAKLRSR